MNVTRQVVSFLSLRGLKLATAESCTAGQIASCLAEVPGSGACLDAGFVTYSPSGKAGFLGVQPATMQQHGLTSEAVAREMAEGALQQEACCAHVAVANTGVADASPSDGPPPGIRNASRGRTACAMVTSSRLQKPDASRAAATKSVFTLRVTRCRASSITSTPWARCAERVSLKRARHGGCLHRLHEIHGVHDEHRP